MTVRLSWVESGTIIRA